MGRYQTRARARRRPDESLNNRRFFPLTSIPSKKTSTPSDLQTFLSHHLNYQISRICYASNTPLIFSSAVNLRVFNHTSINLSTSHLSVAQHGHTVRTKFHILYSFSDGFLNLCIILTSSRLPSLFNQFLLRCAFFHDDFFLFFSSIHTKRK